MEFSVVQGDISQQSADALVNAANTGLRMGSGVAGALRRAAGEELNEEAVSKGPIDLGAVAVMDAYDLDAEYVIHAAGMPPGGQATEQSIPDSVQHTLEKADELQCEHIVMPAIGCGVAGFDFDEGVHVICEVISAYDPEYLKDVTLIAYSDDEYETMARVAEQYQ